MPQFLLDNAFGLIAAALVAYIGLVKLQEWREQAVKDINQLQTDLKDHQKSATPHPMCPVHEKSLAMIESTLVEIKEQVNSLYSHILGGKK
jgi:hypothetical protein